MLFFCSLAHSNHRRRFSASTQESEHSTPTAWPSHLRGGMWTTSPLRSTAALSTLPSGSCSRPSSLAVSPCWLQPSRVSSTVLCHQAFPHSLPVRHSIYSPAAMTDSKVVLKLSSPVPRPKRKRETRKWASTYTISGQAYNIRNKPSKNCSPLETFLLLGQHFLHQQELFFRNRSSACVTTDGSLTQVLFRKFLN